MNQIKLSDREWKEFFLEDLFVVKAGKRLTNADMVDGKRPFVGATDNMNGVTGFIGNVNNSLDKNVLGVNYNGAPCICFYHPYECLFTDDVKRLHLKKYEDNAYVFLFMKSIIMQQENKYSYGYKFNERRMLRQLLLVPIDDNNEPDYDFMEEYMKKLMLTKRKQYQEHIEQCLAELGINIKNIQREEANILFERREWKAIPITNLFDKFVSGKGKGLNHLNQSQEDLAYIGATNRNNGVICFVEDNDVSCKMIQSGNCIGFIKNGDGSAGYAIYKREKFVSTSDVIYGYASWLNEYTGLFFVSAQDLIKSKYSHGYKRNQQHLRGDKVMLPVDNNDEPDYEFMEECGRKMMVKKYIQYLEFLKQIENGEKK